MAANSDPNTPQQPSDLQAMLARLRGMSGSPGTATAPEPPKAAAATAVAAPPPPAPPAPPKPAAPPAAARPAPAAAPPAPKPAAPVAAIPPKAAGPQICAVCKSPRAGAEDFCMNCGCVWPAPGSAAAAGATAAGTLLKGRYELGGLIKEYGGVSRNKGTDRGGATAQPVVIIHAPVGGGANGEVQPGFDADLVPNLNWPSVGWEKNLLEKADSPCLPKIVEHFSENGEEYLVIENPVGQSLWNAWDDPDSTWEQRFGWLKNVAQALQAIHKHGPAIIEGLRPDIVTVPPGGGAILADLADLLPLPLPSNAPIRGSHYTAPEVAMARESTDARSDHYSFGAMLYALHLGRELSDQDFEKNGLAKHFIARFPDVHPLYGRLVMRTLQRDVGNRLPSDEAGKKDATGFQELIDILEVGRRNFGIVRQEIACWTTTGIVRTNNEDAFSLIHAAETRMEDFSEYTLVVLADGMGGYEAGEIAAALCLDTLREKMVAHGQLAAVAGKKHAKQGELDVNAMKKFIYDAMKETNKVVFQAPSKGIGRRGMGCTAEVIYMDGQNIVVGHIGDSRTYHYSQGRLHQLTRDQTLVNRLVELGQITAEEADNHPRKNELQQAVGGRADVEPAVYSAKLRAGDWVLCTTDGLTGHVKNDELQEMFQLEAGSADTAARRLVNFANLRGATDNTTVVVIRCL